MHRGSQQTFSAVRKKCVFDLPGRWLTLYLVAFALVDLGAGVQKLVPFEVADRLRFRLRGGWSRGTHTHTHTSMSAAEHVKFTASGYRRPLHWVLKIGSLEKSLEFFEKVLGMKVHRHEEFASGCEATCNGPYGGAWSKTMIGYNMEETNFALELTYNYGISQYTPGNDLRFIALRKSALQADAGALGYVIEKDRHSGNEVIVGPDGYRFMLVDTSEGDASEPFLFVSIHVADLAQALSFHTAVLGAKNLSGNTPGSPPRDDAAVVGFSEEGTRIELVQLTPAMGAVDHGMASGRFATETEDGAPAYIAEKVKSAGVGTIQHGPIKLQPHNEEVVIVKDVDGYEYCFVDARGFKECVNVAYHHRGQTVDWDFRNKLLQASLAPENAKLEVAKVLAGHYDKEDVQAQLQAALSNTVVVFSQSSCPYCLKAKELLSGLGAAYEVMELDKRSNGHALRMELAARTSCPTLPQIFIAGKFVGGFSNGVEALHKSGQLTQELRAAGALDKGAAL